CAACTAAPSPTGGARPPRRPAAAPRTRWPARGRIPGSRRGPRRRRRARPPPARAGRDRSWRAPGTRWLGRGRGDLGGLRRALQLVVVRDHLLHVLAGFLVRRDALVLPH